MRASHWRSEAVDSIDGDADDGYEWYDEVTGAAPDGRGRSSRRRTSERPLSIVQPGRLAFRLQAPLKFDDSQLIADRYRVGDPVIVDLRECDTALALRLIDFCSGLTYALEGSLEFVTERVLLLAPQEVVLSGSPELGIRGRGFFNRM